MERPPRASPWILRRLSVTFTAAGAALAMGVVVLSGGNVGIIADCVAFYIATVATLFAAVELRTRHLRKRLRSSSGALCPSCGYDIGGLSDSLECRECGRPFDPEADAAYWRRHVLF